MTAPISIRYGFATDVGVTRPDNQDACGKFPPDDQPLADAYGMLFVVADGMGGHQGGSEASRSAVRATAERYFASREPDPGERLREAVAYANDVVVRRARESDALRGMGTTCTALAVVGGVGWLAHVGDSRAYRATDREMEQMTTDHTHVEELVRLSLISREEAAVHPQRHVLVRSLGLTSEVAVDVHGPIPLRGGERYLLCTDGLASVPLHDVQHTLLALPPEEACARLVSLANDAGGSDNVTVLVVQIEAAPNDGHRRRWWAF